jgi:ABC-type multidrug transport system fused ATPase/permease subunit
VREPTRSTTLLVSLSHTLTPIVARNHQTLLVMDAGAVVEQGSPAALRARPGSKFAAMAAANVL